MPTDSLPHHTLRWEPLVEPFELELSTTLNRHTREYEVALSTSAPLNVNVTASVSYTHLTLPTNRCG